jgi:hypothetical protein
MQLPLLVRLLLRPLEPRQLLRLEPPVRLRVAVAVHPVDLVVRVKVVLLRPLMPLTRDTPTVVGDAGITGRFGRKSG